jgi:hypothetical protein
VGNEAGSQLASGRTACGAATLEHDTQKQLFVLTHPDGKTEHFRDNPARHLVIEPDPETGEMRPVTTGN